MNGVEGVDDGWSGAALGAVLGRVTVGLGEVGARFPLSADPATGRWTTTRRGSWTGGFWAGLLWLRARHTGSATDRTAAEACTARLTDWTGADTATRGLILWYGTALAPDSAPARRLRDHAARTCLTAYDPELGLVPWGAAFGGPRELARADAVPGLVPLLASAGPHGGKAAMSHLYRHLDLCLGTGAGAGSGADEPVPGQDEAPAPAPLRATAWRHDPRTGWHPLTDPPPGWSRGRAWLLLAVADALTLPGGAAGTAPTTGTASSAGVAGSAEAAGNGGAASTAGADRTTGTTEDHAQLRAAARRLGAPLDTTSPPAGATPEAITPESTTRAGAPLVPPADEAHPGGPVDTSAAAITAVALLKLASLPGGEDCGRRAVAVLRRLVTAHLSGSDGSGGSGNRRPPSGMLLDGCHDATTGTAVRHELVWGDFFLALGLAALTGLVDLRDV
ncbi:sugar ABC transporter permease [Streptomyces sp. NPDC017940]|uniref:sugar ABC transporter permease n=1 Tax=Streptomyces sp. NPDC017940 TaxID=3365017 RepID=UPI003790939C